MNCSQVREHLASLADAELTGETRHVVESHVACCCDCQATVARWQALRACACRAVGSECVPSDLAVRLQQRLHARQPPRRVWRIARAVSAAAAVVLLAVLGWQFFLPTAGGGRAGVAAAASVAPSSFARIHRLCALQHHHDQFGVRDECPSAAQAELAERLKFRVLVPDLSASGFKLAGACPCFPVQEVRAVHAFYRRPADDERVVSVFSLDRRVRMESSHEPDLPSNHSIHRRYQQAEDGGVTVLKWDEDGVSFALCGMLTVDELCNLAEAVDLAALRGHAVTLASAAGP